MALSERIREISKKYVDQQLATMRKYGAVSKLSAKEYNALINQIAEVTSKACRAEVPTEAPGHEQGARLPQATRPLSFSQHPPHPRRDFDRLV